MTEHERNESYTERLWLNVTRSQRETVERRAEEEDRSISSWLRFRLRDSLRAESEPGADEFRTSM